MPLLQCSPVIPVTMGAARGTAHERGESRGACRQCCTGAACPSRDCHHRVPSLERVGGDMPGGLGRVEDSKDSESGEAGTDREAGEMQGESMFDVVH